jgi:hypothetical protein
MGDSYQDLLGANGWFDTIAYEVADRLPRLDDEAEIPLTWGRRLILQGPTLLGLQYTLALIAALFMALGVATRWTAPLTWLAVVIFSSNPLTYYGGDALLLVLTLYLAGAYSLLGFDGSRGWRERIFGDATAPVWRWRRRMADASTRPSTIANIALRLIQVHFAIIVFAAALHKFQEPEWWAGDALWYSIYTPFETDVKSLLSQAGSRNGELVLLSLAAYATLGWQLAYPILPASGWGRVALLVGSLIGWIWCSFMARQPLFGPSLFIAALAALEPGFWPRGFFTRSNDSHS